ncbi:hypothetical protein [Flavobacterium sp.]|uniref:hypothetical protein n=1 Tax=Flavobacterium sp. TaxID=239 RepID=UPI0037526E7A
MKFLFTILLSAVLLFPSFGNMMVYFTFKINQDEIIKTICIQRQLVNNTCNGSCELQKSLKKLDSEKKSESSFKENFELVYTQFAPQYEFNSILFLEDKQQIFTLISNKPTSVSFAVFHPPLV